MLFADLPRTRYRIDAGARVLLFAPHPDDELLGCGGTLIRHRALGNPVKVVFVTDGQRGDPEGRHADIVELRRREAVAALTEANVHDVEFWDYPDGAVTPSPPLLASIARVLESFTPSVLFAPSPLEVHPDHRATAQAVWQVWRRSDVPQPLFLYEIGVPLFPNVLVDISAEIQQKAAAIQHYQSQLAYHPYLDYCLAINRARAYSLGPSSTHAEAFFRAETPDILERSAFWRTLLEGRDLDSVVHDLEARLGALEARLRLWEQVRALGSSLWRRLRGPRQGTGLTPES